MQRSTRLAAHQEDAGSNPAGPSPAELARCLEVLEALRALPPDDPRYLEAERAAAHLTKSAKKKRRLARKRAARAADQALLREPPSSAASPAPRLHNQRRCFACQGAYREVDADTPQLCPACSAHNRAHLAEEVDLSGRRVLITGGRVRIGHAAALRLLRAGARVLVTTRFPRDAARRFADAPDAADWGERLELHGLDLRDLPALLPFTDELRARGEPLEVLINNAAQTVRMPEAERAELVAGERQPLGLELAGWVRGEAEPPTSPALLPSTTSGLSEANAWVQRLAEVSPLEVLEAQLINATAPALLLAGVEPLLLRSPFPDRHVVNVTSAEGWFARARRPATHPHTNMAKAALNMLTLTAAPDYAARGIYLNAVDPGWVSPLDAEGKTRAGLGPPLRLEDAAARLLDPIARGARGAPVSGLLLKDYRSVDW